MLQRIYATAWKAPDQLKAYKKMLVEAKKRDHRVLGKRLDLFSIQVSGAVYFIHVLIYEKVETERNGLYLDCC
jgi:threonyl-tRNA synthetase